MTEPYTCVLCEEEKEGYGNNPVPLADEGKCCDECNQLVILSRLEQLICSGGENATTKKMKCEYCGEHIFEDDLITDSYCCLKQHEKQMEEGA
tara:strand:- start:158 stop:436 length:279 start_codon:yes stop_codon:yes gene_type:complete